MHVDMVRNYCLQKKGVTESFPFNDEALVFKVMGKMFALTSLNAWEAGQPTMNLKCDPERALILRADYTSVRPGFHMNKKHWNTIELYHDEFTFQTLTEWIDHSYDLVVQGMTKKMKTALNELAWPTSNR